MLKNKNKNDNKTSLGLFCFCLLCFQVVFRNSDHQAVKDYVISQQSSCGQCPTARCALQRQPLTQLYHLSHSRFKSQTKQRRNTGKSLSLRESWRYERRSGTVGLAQSVWHSRYGTVGLALQTPRCEELEACKLGRQRATGTRRGPGEKSDYTE